MSDDDAESDPGGDCDEAAEDKAVSKAWGKPFRVEWLSTSRIPFYRTRGLRNNLNSGREVKVARDGTELEETVGRRLVQMFHQTRGPVAAPAAAGVGVHASYGAMAGLTLSAEVIVG